MSELLFLGVDVSGGDAGIISIPKNELYEEFDPNTTPWPAPDPSTRIPSHDEQLGYDQDIRMEDEEEGSESNPEISRPLRTPIPDTEPVKKKFFPRRTNDELVAINSLASVIELRKPRPFKPWPLTPPKDEPVESRRPSPINPPLKPLKPKTDDNYKEQIAA